MTLQRPRGTRDFLPDEMEERRALEGGLRRIAGQWGYREIGTPAFEDAELFTIRSGEGIIHEMYAFEDKGGRLMALRPELTAPVIRLYLNEARVSKKPIRWFYFGNCFRYERPQKGRYREFWQFGAELIGMDCAGTDAEVVMLAQALLCATGITFSLQIGHLAFMQKTLSGLDPETRRRVRALIDKRDKDSLEALLDGREDDVLSRITALASCTDLEDAFAISGVTDERDRILEVFSLLDAGEVSYTLNPGIARGLDYYTGMVFEAFAQNLGAENQVMGGGAYRLAHLFGGEDTPSCGFGIGFDRVMASRGVREPSPSLKVAVIATPEGRTWAVKVAAAMRSSGLTVISDHSDRSIGSRIGGAVGEAAIVAIIGGREAADLSVTLKDLASGVQTTLPLSEAVTMVVSRGPCG
ncbi:MAG: histidine--tRNA ligase [Methanomicrobiales archaeon]|nr:histidine--tRNA ligase [Methanomicrobiales archaeon]